VHVIDVIARVVLITLVIAFMFGCVVGLAVGGYAVIRDSFGRDEDHSLSLVGPHSRRALDFLMPWLRRLFLVWFVAVATALTWVLIHKLFASSA
jgi:hypothetical protein